jgi:hypothetical protein
MRPPSRNIALVAGLVIAAMAGCSDAHLQGDNSRPSRPTSSSAAAAVTCSGSEGRELLQRLFRSISRGGPVETQALFASAERFTRWWDPSLPPGHVLGYHDLRRHLRWLAGQHVDLSLGKFEVLGFQRANGTGDEGGWFRFAVASERGADERVSRGHGKGAVDCNQGRLRAVVIDSW